MIKAAPSSKKMPAEKGGDRKKASGAPPALKKPEAMVARTATEKRRDAADVSRETPVDRRLAVAPKAPGEEGVELTRQFLLQVTPAQLEWLEAQRRTLGFRSRAETIRYWLQQAVEGRIG